MTLIDKLKDYIKTASIQCEVARDHADRYGEKDMYYLKFGALDAYKRLIWFIEEEEKKLIDK